MRVIERAAQKRPKAPSVLVSKNGKIQKDGMKTVGHWSVPTLPQHPEWINTFAVADLLQGDRNGKQQDLIDPRWYGFVGQIGMWWAWDNLLSSKGRGYGAKSQEEAIRRLIEACNKE